MNHPDDNLAVVRPWSSFFGNPALLSMMGLLLLMALAYFRSSVQITGEWSFSGAYSHGPLALLLAGYLFWLDRRRLAIAGRLHWLPVLGIIASGAAWLLAAAANVFFIELVALSAIFVNALGLLFGIRVWWLSAAAIAVIFLAMPVWDLLQVPLQSLAAEVTYMVLQWLQIPVYRQSFLFTVPGGSFIVEEACSGLGFLLTAGILGVGYARIANLSIRQSAMLITAAVVMAIASNWLRIVSIMVVGNASQMQHPVVTDHLAFGWILFAVLLIPFLLIAVKVFPGNAAGTEREPELQGQQATGTHLSIVKLTTIAVLLLLPPGLFWALDNRSSGSTTDQVVEKVQEQLPALTVQGAPVDWQPRFNGASQVALYRSVVNGDALQVLVVGYASQSPGAELINVNNSPFDRSRWRRLESVRQNDFNTLRLGTRGQTRLVAFTYLVNGTLTADPLEAKIQELLGFFSGRRAAFLVALAVDGATDEHRLRLSETSILLRQKLLE